MQGKPKKRSGGGSVKNQPEEVAEQEPTLRDAREARGLSVDEVAHELHLSREVVMSLEAGDFEFLGAPVFVKGHLRSYARLLELPDDSFTAGFKAAEPAPEEFRTLSTRKELKPGASLSNFVLWLLLAILLVVAAVYLLMGDANVSGGDVADGDFQASEFVKPQPPAPAEPDAGEAQAEPESSEIPAASDIVRPVAVSVRETDFVTAEMPAAEPQAIVQTPVAEPEVVVEEPQSIAITLRFEEECWVEVSDVNRRLLYGMEKPGATVELEGLPPFKVFLGNVTGVSMEVAGKPFNIPDNARLGGNTARFRIAKDEIR